MRIKSIKAKQFGKSRLGRSSRETLLITAQKSLLCQLFNKSIFSKSILNTLQKLFMVSCLMFFSSGVAFADKDSKKIIITVNQYVNHVALDGTYRGLKTSLSDRGYLPKKVELIYGNAQGNISNSVQISRHHASLDPDFMVAIATPSMQTNLKAKADAGDHMIAAFLAVTDISGLNIDDASGNIIGITDSPPIAELFVVVKKLFTDLRTVGVLYNAGEINSVKVVDDLQKIAANSDFAIKTVTISNSSDIKGAITKLAGEVDIIYLPQDNTVISALNSVVALAKRSKIPLIANDPTLVERGVMLALGTNYFSSGKQLGNMIMDIIEGNQPESMIQNSKSSELQINNEIVEILNIKIPDQVIQDKRLVK